MQVINNPHLSLNQVADQYLQTQKTSGSAAEKTISFQDIFYQKYTEETEREGLKFSKHAAGRLADRNITLSGEQIQRLHEAASIASEKGIKESLVVVDSLAFIVNIPNQTVVTAMDNTQADENVYTNIDGAVIM